MDYEKYLNKQFIIQFIFIFVLLYIFCSFIQFLGNPIILSIITFFLTVYLNRNELR